ncbi:hydroxyacyl-thioester dehydratase type 2, mitochondrial-like [Rhynchophorus ferrugineus]|uniref:hydroxyacyl-thioester dehydratase type 2, mitochondrial-like n=1 Tax=Rhynchophorus ferrugineus TaxID=354439 RepID=UPI003FCCC72F
MVGDQATLTKRISAKDVNTFMKLSGDSNPIHSSVGDQNAVVHGAYLNSLVSCIIGTKLPGAGTLVVKQTLNFPNKCFVGDTVTVTVKVLEIRKIIKVAFNCMVEEDEKVVLYGDAHLIMEKHMG